MPESTKTLTPGVPATQVTDPTGRCFLCYRRSRLGAVQAVAESLLDVGVPVWQDLRNLRSKPLAPALRAAIEAADTACALVWVSRDLPSSPTIRNVEAPAIFGRVRSDPRFFAELWLEDGIEFAEATALIRPEGMVEDPSAAWHLERAAGTTDDRGARSLDSIEARRVAALVLARRLAAIHSAFPAGEPLRVSFNAHAQADDGFTPGYALLINWSRHFTHRFAPEATWTSSLLPALDVIARSLRSAAPKRGLVVEGKATIASCLAFGRAFREVAGVPVAWVQRPAGVPWSLAASDEESGIAAAPLQELDLSSNDLAVLVSVTGDVEPAVAATAGLPRFRAMARVRPADGSARRDLRTPGQAAHLARLIAQAIRDARHACKGIQRAHLFFAGPAGLAVMVGQQLNALGPVQTYEHVQHENSVGRYVPAALLVDAHPGR